MSTNITIFTFSDWIALLAILVIILTIVDFRYKFRMSVTRILGIQANKLYIGFIFFIGLASLLSELWFSQNYPLPCFFPNQLQIQFCLGVILLVTIFIWIWYSILYPPIFNKNNHIDYFNELYKVIIKGDDHELAVISDELSRSAKELIKQTYTTQEFNKMNRDGEINQSGDFRMYAYEIIRLIGSPNLCKNIIISSPGTAIAFFESAVDYEKYDIPLGPFSVNISSEAISNKNSILHAELNGYSSGHMGLLKLFTKAIYGDYTFVESLGQNCRSPFDINLVKNGGVDLDELKAYVYCTKITFQSYMALIEEYSQNEAGREEVDFSALYRAMNKIQAVCDGCKYQYAENIPNDLYQRIDIIISFFMDIIKILNNTQCRTEGIKNVYEKISELLFEIIKNASFITHQNVYWSIQHNLIWNCIFNEFFENCLAMRMIRKRLRRLIYDKIKEMEQFPNYVSMRLLGMMLNILGLRESSKDNVGNTFYILNKVILKWTSKHYFNIAENYPDVAKTCCFGKISFDKENRQLISTFYEGMNRTERKTYLDLD